MVNSKKIETSVRTKNRYEERGGGVKLGLVYAVIPRLARYSKGHAYFSHGYFFLNRCGSLEKDAFETACKLDGHTALASLLSQN